MAAFPDGKGGCAGQWSPDGAGNGTHVASKGAGSAATGELELFVNVANCNIKKIDLKAYNIKKPNCSVILSINGQTVQTTEKYGLDPEWEEDFTFKVANIEQKLEAKFMCGEGGQVGDTFHFLLDKLVLGKPTFKGLIVPGGKVDMMVTAVNFGEESAPVNDDSFMDFL
ncbi:hypothetical protein CYMTET_56179 [Cymbomonas tetramitiformis]|uniref:C2 domain-containing protein n=1 Tax=Cymbomonas tetramitiformis TaxID=36881 RepID=A0AAE0BBU1_9CHLO|nr:hypothetical protein CYMTET_56179 [Cymbomonas tetramitiformis]|eukprot:gene24621-29949_t